MAAVASDGFTANLQFDGVDRSTTPPPDPLVPRSTPRGERRTSHRFSAFDTALFSKNAATTSPSTARRALEAHLSETDRRLEETSRLGTALVQQRQELAERLVEVQQQQTERELGPELRQKLADVEKEYNELGRDSTRAFLAPKLRLQPGDDSSTDGRVSPMGVDNLKPAYTVNRLLEVLQSFMGKPPNRHPKLVSLPGSCETSPAVGSMI